MLLCTLPSEETFRWGRWGGEKNPEDLPDMFYDFCWQRAADLRAQVQSLEEIEEEARVTAWPSGYPRWLRPWERSVEATTCRRCARCSKP
jgi:hypothetical protein